MSNEWYTPSKYIEAAREVMGTIDLDPASCALANQTVKATTYYTQEDDGLSKAWYGNVWLNPPYKSDDGQRVSLQSQWVRKALQEYTRGNVSKAILLVTGVTERKWFEPLWDYVVCFPNHQVHFKTPEKGKYHHPYGSVFVYLGHQEQHFINGFSQFGRIAMAVDVPVKSAYKQLELVETI